MVWPQADSLARFLRESDPANPDASQGEVCNEQHATWIGVLPAAVINSCSELLQLVNLLCTEQQIITSI